MITVEGKVRVRFAPSPTGPLHLGGIRTALYNFLFAKRHHGTFILRIEDTDQARFVPGAEQYIIDSLTWAGLIFDEGPGKGGLFAPYRQSERTDLYRIHIEKLLSEGNAYFAFETPKELEILRSGTTVPGHAQFQYNSQTRSTLKNSLHLSSSDVNARIASGEPYVVRIKIPEDEIITFHDLIRGEVRVHSSSLDDKVLFKSDGLPTYHLANVVDDHIMLITHVIRGEEWLPSAPMHQLLYRFFGWQEEMPSFAHLPLILKPDGNGKLSKRDGDRLGFPVFPLQWTDPFTSEVYHGYREDGYLPEAFINMLALLGWNPGTDQEIFSCEDLISLFTLDRVHKSGSRFDPEKARWFNHQYVQKLSEEHLVSILTRSASGFARSDDKEYLTKIIRLIRERITLLPDLWQQAWFFFHRPESYDPQVKAKIWNPEAANLIERLIPELVAIKIWNKETIHQKIQDFVQAHSLKLGQIMNPLRFLTVGSNQGPGLMDIADLIGKEEFLFRISSVPD